MYRNILRHNCLHRNWNGEDRLLVDEMYPRKGNSIVVIQNPIHTEKCHGLSRQVKLELHLGILVNS